MRKEDDWTTFARAVTRPGRHKSRWMDFVRGAAAALDPIPAPHASPFCRIDGVAFRADMAVLELDRDRAEWSVPEFNRVDVVEKAYSGKRTLEWSDHHKPSQVGGEGDKPNNAPPQNTQVLNERQNIQILKEAGIDVDASPETIRAILSLVRSKSSSPYTSAEMLEQYVVRGFPHLPDKIVQVIDLQVQHRQSLEQSETMATIRRESRAQTGALALAILGASGSLLAAYFGVPSSVCISVAVICVGGPNAATIVARLIDRHSR